MVKAVYVWSLIIQTFGNEIPDYIAQRNTLSPFFSVIPLIGCDRLMVRKRSVDVLTVLVD